MRQSRRSHVPQDKRSFVLRFIAAALACAALALSLSPASPASVRSWVSVSRIVVGGSSDGVVDALPLRSEVQCDNERRGFDERLLPFSNGASYDRGVATWPDFPPHLSEYDARCERQLPRFRRRIPRMNTEDPPGARPVLPT